MKPRLAWVGVDRQIHVMDVEGQQRRQLTVSLASNPLLVWGRPDLMGAIYGWPCWDPSGQRVACFETRGRPSRWAKTRPGRHRRSMSG